MRAFWIWVAITILASILLGLPLGMMNGVRYDGAHRYPPAPSKPGDANVADIAGDYSGDASLSILPDGRYSLVDSECVAVLHRESGYVHNSDGIYELSPVREFNPGIERRFLLVRWQSRRYLVPPERMEEFCDAVITLVEPRTDSRRGFYLDNPVDQPDGLPQLTDEWARYLLRNSQSAASPP